MLEGIPVKLQEKEGLLQHTERSWAYVITVSIMPSKNLQKISTRSLEGEGKQSSRRASSNS
jgi:hypothetical protein